MRIKITISISFIGIIACRTFISHSNINGCCASFRCSLFLAAFCPNMRSIGWRRTNQHAKSARIINHCLIDRRSSVTLVRRLLMKWLEDLIRNRYTSRQCVDEKNTIPIEMRTQSASSHSVICCIGLLLDLYNQQNSGVRSLYLDESSQCSVGWGIFIRVTDISA